jgi:hypothetical protein
MDNRTLMIAAVVAVVVILAALYYAHATCHLGKYSKSSCAKSGFCGGAPDPDAAAEAKGLAELGWQPEPAGPYKAPVHGCGVKPASAALAEALSLQSAGALPPAAPYYTVGGDMTAAENAEAKLGSGSSGGSGGSGAADAASGDFDSFAAHKLGRDKAAFSSTTGRQRQLFTNPAQIAARRARFSSVRDGFAGPSAGFGWDATGRDELNAPTHPDPVFPPQPSCLKTCFDGCNGTNCVDACADQCSS